MEKQKGANSQIIKKYIYLFIPTITNFILYYFLYLKPVIQAHYENMNEVWSQGYHAFITPSNFTTFFADKLQVLINLPIENKYIHLIFLLSTFLLFTQKNKLEKLFLVFLPIVLLIIGNIFHIYPFEERLILFALPLFIIIFAQFVVLLLPQKLTSFILILLTIFVSLSQLEKYQERYIRTSPYTKEVIQILKDQQDNNVNLIQDYKINNYYLYTHNIKANITNFYTSNINSIDNLNNLNSDVYYLIVPYSDTEPIKTNLIKLRQSIHKSKNCLILYEWNSNNPNLWDHKDWPDFSYVIKFIYLKEF